MAAWLLEPAIAIVVVIFEVVVVLVLRAHYTMDVITGIFAAFCVAWGVQKLSTAER